MTEPVNYSKSVTAVNQEAAETGSSAAWLGTPASPQTQNWD